MSDGQHIIGILTARQAHMGTGVPQINVVLNWFDEVRQRAPVK